MPWESDHWLLLLAWSWLLLHLLVHHLIWILHHLGGLTPHHTWLLSWDGWLGHSLWSAVIIVLLVALGLVNKVLPLRLLTLLPVVLRLIRLVRTLVATSSGRSSATASSLVIVATSATIGSVSFLTVPSILSLIALVPSATDLWHTTCLWTKFLLTHYVSDELLKSGSTLLSGFKFQIILGLPEVDLEGLGTESKAVGGVEHLDTLLG